MTRTPSPPSILPPALFAAVAVASAPPTAIKLELSCSTHPFQLSMCQQIAEGTRWTRCGHFQRHMVIAILDCNLQHCRRSYLHPATCQLPTCFTDFGEEIQRDIDRVDDFCFACRAAQARAAGVPLR